MKGIDMGKYRIISEHGYTQDFDVENDIVAKLHVEEEVSIRAIYCDILLYRYSDTRSIADKWEFISSAHFSRFANNKFGWTWE